MASAAVTAVVIVIAVAVGPRVLGPGPSSPGHLATNPVKAPLSFHPLPLDAHWHGRVAYATRDGVVFLTGTARLSGPLGPLATLPPLARPASGLEIVASLGFGRLGPTAIPPLGTIEVAPSGLISVFRPSSPRAYPVAFVSLDGLSFPIGCREPWRNKAMS